MTAPLSNIQLELLKLYHNRASDEDLLAINDMIIKYFANKIEEPIISKKEKLKQAFFNIAENDIFCKINDPTAWQKQLRNEWE